MLDVTLTLDRSIRHTLSGALHALGLAVVIATFSVLSLGEANAAPIVPAIPVVADLGGNMHGDTDDTLAFTPDGNTVFFDRSTVTTKTVMVTRRVHGRWTTPKVASFSGHWFDQNPVVSPDGSYLIFNSDRPTRPTGKPLVQTFFGAPHPGSNLWKVRRIGNRWSEPVWLGPVINDSRFIDSPSIVSDGSVYFLRRDHGAVHIFRSQFSGGRYLRPARVALGDPAITTHDPTVAPDESFIVFDYGKVKNGLGRLCIAFREGDQWSKPLDLGDEVDRDIPWSPHLGPDHRTVYFTGATHSWSLSLTPWLSVRAAR
jgi:Tol biopolymer transport system component